MAIRVEHKTYTYLAREIMKTKVPTLYIAVNEVSFIEDVQYLLCNK